MAKSKSSPKESRSKTPSKPPSDEGPHKSHESASFSKRKADFRAVDTQTQSKRLAVGKERGRPIEATLDEATFKKQFAADFYNVPIKKEPIDTALESPPTPAVSQFLPNTSSQVPSVSRSSATPRDGKSDQFTDSARKDFSPEEVLVSIVFRQPFVEQLAKVGIEHFIQEGGPCNDFGINRVQDFIARLDSTGIHDDLRIRVVGLLQQNLRSTCNTLRARIGDIGRLSPDKNPKPPFEAEYSKESTSVENHSCSINGAKDVGSHRTKLTSSLVPAIKQPSGSQSVVQQYGTASMKGAFDILARCVIDACSLAPRDDDDPVMIRQYAHKAWRKVSYLQKSDWQNLFDRRYDSETNIFSRGQDVLRAHRLLALVVPDFHLRVWDTGTSASRISKNAETEPSPTFKTSSPRSNVLHMPMLGLDLRGRA